MPQTLRQSSQPVAWVPRQTQAQPKDRQPVLNVPDRLCKTNENLNSPGKKHIRPFRPAQVVEST